MTSVLLDLRRRALKSKDADQVALIDAALQDDAEAYTRAVVGTDVRLTRAQWRTLVAIVRLTRRLKGLPPTLQELADDLRISKCSVHGMLETLRKRGVVLRERYRSRSVVLVALTDPPDPATRSAAALSRERGPAIEAKAPVTLPTTSASSPDAETARS